jgi:capsular polysaccharide biosynthesis protein
MTVGYALRHYWWTALALVAIGLVAAAVAAHVRTPTYQATAMVQIDTTDAVNPGTIDTSSQETRATQYIQLVQSPQLLRQVCAAPSLRGVPCDPTALPHQLSTSLVKSTTMVAISVSAPQASWASALANEIANQLVEEQSHSAQQFYAKAIATQNSKLQSLSAQIAGVQQQIAAVQGNIVLSPAAAAQITGPLSAQLDLLQSQYGSTYSNLTSLQQKQLDAERAISVAEAATPPTLPADPILIRYLAAGGGAGLVIGLLLMFLVARLDPRMLDMAAFSKAADLGFVFEVAQRASKAETAATFVHGVAGILGRHPDASAILVTTIDRSADPQSVAGALADAAIELRSDVRVVTEQPTSNGNQLTAATSQEQEADVMTLGNALQALPASHSAQRRPRSLVIYAAGPAESSSLAMLIAPRVDLVVLVARHGSLRERAVRTARLLRSVGVESAHGIFLSGLPVAVPQPWMRAQRARSA